MLFKWPTRRGSNYQHCALSISSPVSPITLTLILTSVVMPTPSAFPLDTTVFFLLFLLSTHLHPPFSYFSSKPCRDSLGLFSSRSETFILHCLSDGLGLSRRGEGDARAWRWVDVKMKLVRAHSTPGHISIGAANCTSINIIPLHVIIIFILYSVVLIVENVCELP